MGIMHLGGSVMRQEPERCGERSSCQTGKVGGIKWSVSKQSSLLFIKMKTRIHSSLTESTDLNKTAQARRIITSYGVVPVRIGSGSLHLPGLNVDGSL